MKKAFAITAVLLWAAACGQPQQTPSAHEENLTPDDSVRLAQELNNFRPGNQIETMSLVFGKPKYTIKNIGILVYDDVNDLDVMGPRYIMGQAMGATTQLIGIKPGSIKTVMGVEITPNTIIDSVKQLDILIIPGGFKGTVEAAYNIPLLQWIQTIDQTSRYTASVCTGGWILGASGLLQGKRASTNWYREEEFLKKYGAIPANERYTRDGKYWTSAGVSAGMDMALAMIQDIYGKRYAEAIMLDMEYDPNPPFSGGSPEKTGWVVNQLMKNMYDAGINPLIDSLEKTQKTPAISLQK